MRPCAGFPCRWSADLRIFRDSRKSLWFQRPHISLISAATNQCDLWKATCCIELPARWQRPIGCLNFNVTLCELATNYRALSRGTTKKYQAFYGSSPPFMSLCCAVYRMTWCTMYKTLAVCCSVCVAVCCSVLRCVAVCCGVLWCVAVCCSMMLYIGWLGVICIRPLHLAKTPRVSCVLQCVAVCCSVLQCVAVGCSV